MIDEITINIHSSIRIQGARVIYFDPYQITDEPHDADAIFITHDHFDHFDPASIEKILKDDTMMVIPKTSFNAWSDSGLIVTQVMQMSPGEKVDIGGLVIESVPAYNHLKPFHPRRKNWLGYLVTMEDRRIYVAGDTDVTEESRQVRCDIAFVPVGGKYTMNAAKAAELINEIEPEIAVPTHYGSEAGKESDGRDFKLAVKKGIRVPLLIRHSKSEKQIKEEEPIEAEAPEAAEDLETSGTAESVAAPETAERAEVAETMENSAAPATAEEAELPEDASADILEAMQAVVLEEAPADEE